MEVKLKIKILLDKRFLSQSEKNNHYVKVCGILWDTALMGLSLAEKGMAIQLFLIANVQKSAEIETSLEILSGKTSILRDSYEILRETKAILKRLEMNKIISLTKRQRIQYIEENSIEENNIEGEVTLSPLPPKEVFNPDLESIYQIYPKKVGKKKGIEQLAKVITSQELFDQILIGTKNYIQSCQNENRYFKDFSTFVNQEVWEDYQDGHSSDQFNQYLEKFGRME